MCVRISICAFWFRKEKTHRTTSCLSQNHPPALNINQSLMLKTWPIMFWIIMPWIQVSSYNPKPSSWKRSWPNIPSSLLIMVWVTILLHVWRSHQQRHFLLVWANDNMCSSQGVCKELHVKWRRYTIMMNAYILNLGGVAREIWTNNHGLAKEDH